MSKGLAAHALDEARKLVGIMEQGGNNTGKAVLAIIRENGGSGPEAWCGDFVAACYNRARVAMGRPRLSTRLWASVRELGHVKGTRFVKYARGGDIVTFVFDHTGIVVAYANASGHLVGRRKATHLYTIEGNTGKTGAVSDSKTGGDGVYKKLRPLSQVAHFVRVAH